MILQGSVNFKFGVLFAKEGQLTDDEMFSNGKFLLDSVQYNPVSHRFCMIKHSVLTNTAQQ